MSSVHSKWFYYGLVLIAWAAYIALAAAIPQTSQQQVHLNKAVVLVLAVTLFVPYLLTWLIGMLGWYHFSRFVDIVRRKHLPNDVAFRSILHGLGLLILDLIAIPFFSAARSVWMSNQHTVASLTILSNYTHIVITLLAFGFLFRGSRLLARSGHYAIGVRSRVLPALVATCLFALLFSLAVFSNPSRQTATPQSGIMATYYLPDYLILTTIIVPLAGTWFLGLQAALNTERYVHSLSHPLWKRAILKYFYGLLAIVSSAIILQGITMVGSQQLQQINLALTLFLVYLFIIIQAGGYLFIKSSAKQLRSLIESGETDETD